VMNAGPRVGEGSRTDGFYYKALHGPIGEGARGASGVLGLIEGLFSTGGRCGGRGPLRKDGKVGESSTL